MDSLAAYKSNKLTWPARIYFDLDLDDLQHRKINLYVLWQKKTFVETRYLEISA